MIIEGSETLPGTPEQLWNVLFDPDVIASTIPGCRSLEQVSEDRYEGIIDLRMGPFSSSYDATFTLSDKTYPSSYRLEVTAEGSGTSVTARTRVYLEPAGAGVTRMRYQADAALGGALAGLGSFIAEPAARMVIAQGLVDLKKKVQEKMARGGV